MRYDWESIIKDQESSGLSVKEYCEQNNLKSSSLYSAKRNRKSDTLIDTPFYPVEIIEPKKLVISMCVDGHRLEFDSVLLDRVIGALK